MRDARSTINPMRCRVVAGAAALAGGLAAPSFVRAQEFPPKKVTTIVVGSASTGPASASLLAGELLNEMAGIDTVHVPDKGGAPAVTDPLGGQVASYCSTLATAQPHFETGKLIPLAGTGPERLASLPKVPTIAESGYPGYSATNWYAFVASSKAPAAILDRWNTELVKVLRNPEGAERLNSHGLPAQPGTREELAREMEREFQTWGRVIRERKITMSRRPR